jgi:hypothetical protein
MDLYTLLEHQPRQITAMMMLQVWSAHLQAVLPAAPSLDEVFSNMVNDCFCVVVFSFLFYYVRKPMGYRGHRGFRFLFGCVLSRRLLTSRMNFTRMLLAENINLLPVVVGIYTR